MEGIRIKFTVLFLISVWTLISDLSSAHQSHVIVTKQSVVRGSENKNDNRCIALLRRTVIRKELLTYPCFHPVPGVVPVVAHQTNMGLVCRGYTSNPTTQYIRLPTCCPGSQPDEMGRCVQVQEFQTDSQPHESQPKHSSDYTTGTKRLEDLEKYPASYEKKRQEVINKILAHPKHWTPHPMIMRRIDAILKQRQHFLRQMHRDMTQQPPKPPGTVINGLFPSVPHPSLGRPQSLPQIPRPSEQTLQDSKPDRVDTVHVHQSGPSLHHSHHETPHAFHAAMHKHNIPHNHDKQGNPDTVSFKQKANDAFAQQQHNMQMAAKKQMHLTRQQQLFQLEQQRQHAMAMRQRMLHYRRMQQAQAERHQQMAMQQARHQAQQSNRQMPFVPRHQQQSPAQQPYVVQRQYSNENIRKQFPDIPKMRAAVVFAVGPNSIQHLFQQTTVRSFPNVPTHPMRYRVQLPRVPVENPPVNIQPGPNSPFSIPPPPPCFVKYLRVVKKCFLDSNIDIPSDENMFNINFNYNGVCQKREVIMSCIFNNLHPCDTMQEQALIRSTIGHTVDEIHRVCQIGQINGIEERMGGNEKVPMVPDHIEPPMKHVHTKPHEEIPIIPEDHHAVSLGQHTVNVQPHNNFVPEIAELSDPEPEKEPPQVKVPVPEPKHVNSKPTITISEHKDKDYSIGTAHAHTGDDHHDHDHVIRMLELEEEEYYLPILIGTAIGIAGIFILLFVLVCICCRRRLKKKIYIQKETEKPKLFDVYTIGVPPPVYEVNGIPPISYEEAKGEKFTGSPSSVRRHNAENETHQQDVPSVSGVVSDI